MATKKKESYAGVIMFVLGFIIIIAVFIFIFNADYSEGRTAVEATAVQEMYHGELTWFAAYTVDGQAYKSPINGDHSNLSKGKRITVYHDADDPSRVWRNPDKSKVNVVISIFIFIFIIICALVIFNSIMTRKKKRQLTESGELYEYQNPYENNNSVSQNDINKF